MKLKFTTSQSVVSYIFRAIINKEIVLKSKMLIYQIQIVEILFDFVKTINLFVIGKSIRRNVLRKTKNI